MCVLYAPFYIIIAFNQKNNYCCKSMVVVTWSISSEIFNDTIRYDTILCTYVRSKADDMAILV